MLVHLTTLLANNFEKFKILYLHFISGCANVKFSRDTGGNIPVICVSFVLHLSNFYDFQKIPNRHTATTNTSWTSGAPENRPYQGEIRARNYFIGLKSDALLVGCNGVTKYSDESLLLRSAKPKPS